MACNNNTQPYKVQLLHILQLPLEALSGTPQQLVQRSFSAADLSSIFQGIGSPTHTQRLSEPSAFVLLLSKQLQLLLFHSKRHRPSTHQPVSMDCVLAQLFDGEDGISFPPLPDDLDDLIGEDLMQIMAAVTQQDACHHRPASSGDAAGSTGASACHSAGSSPALAASSPLGSAAAGLVPRLVTTCLGASACCAAGGAVAMYEAFARSSGFTGTSGQASGSRADTYSGGDSSDSDDDIDMDGAVDAGAARKGAGSKRKAPEVDWRAIADPSERRRQRRLAKNRVTAARSRERKKSQWSEMEAMLQVRRALPLCV